MNACFSIDTPASPGPVAVLRVVTDDAGAFFDASGMMPVAVGASGVRSVFGLDHALVARPDGRTVLLMPHGGGAIVRGIVERLEGLGLTRWRGGEGRGEEALSEAADTVTARMLDALARAASPLAIDLLLDQPRRWALRRGEDPLADGRVLGRLIEPPVVVAVGAANIGKSSLLNALAGASVALAFDQPGTTRDAVGVLVDLGGLVVRWVDTPGIGGEAGEEWARVREEVARADLVVRCADAGSSGPIGGGLCDRHACAITVGLRTDLAEPGFDAEVWTSTARGSGMDRLVETIRERLVPAAAMADPGAWRFWAE